MNTSARYNRSFLLTVSGLMLFACLLTAVTLWQGPRIRSVVLDPSATTQPNQLLVVRTNQALKSVQPKDITLSPSTPFTATVKGSTIALRFSERLNYETTYTLKVNTKKPMEHQFRTGSANLYYLGVNKDRQSVIAHYDVSSKQSRTVFSHKNISSFIVLKTEIIVVIKQSDNDYRVQRIQKDGRPIGELSLPYRGVIDVLRGSPDGQSFGLVLSHTVGDMTRNTLLLTKPGSHTLRIAKDPSDKPLNVINWLFSADSSHVMAQDIDFNTQILDVSTAKTSALAGQHTALLGNSADSKQIVFRDQQDFVAYDRARQTKQVITVPLGPDYSISDLVPLHNTSGYVVRSGMYQNKKSLQELYVYKNNLRKFFEVDTNRQLISSVTASPNDRYAAILLQNRASENSTFSYQTALVDVSTGKTAGIVDGTDPQWDL